MKMNPASIFGLVMLALFIIAAVSLGNYLIAAMFGMKPSELPAFVQFLSHALGGLLIVLIVRKIFK